MGKYENGQYKTDSELDADRRASVEGMRDLVALGQQFPNFSKFAGIGSGVAVAFLAYGTFGWAWFWCLASGVIPPFPTVCKSRTVTQPWPDAA
jgi:hypothetical protein